MAHPNDPFRAGTRITYQPSDADPPVVLTDVCFVRSLDTHGDGRSEFEALSLRTGATGYGPNAAQAYKNLVVTLARELVLHMAHGAEMTASWLKADRATFRQARTASRLGRDRQRKLLDEVTKLLQMTPLKGADGKRVRIGERAMNQKTAIQAVRIDVDKAEKEKILTSAAA